MKTFHHLVSRAIDEMLETERQDLRRAPGGAEYALGKASLRIVVTRKTIVGITSNRTAQRAIRELGALRLLRPTKSRPRERRGRGRPSDCYEFVLEPNKRLYRALLEAFLRRSMVRPVVDQIADGAPRIHYAEDETAFLEYPLRGFGLGRSKSVRTFRREAMRMLRKRIKEQKVFRDAGFGIGDFIRSWIQARDDALDEASAATGWLVALGVVPASAFVVAPILFPLRQLDLRAAIQSLLDGEKLAYWGKAGEADLLTQLLAYPQDAQALLETFRTEARVQHGEVVLGQPTKLSPEEVKALLGPLRERRSISGRFVSGKSDSRLSEVRGTRTHSPEVS